MATGHSLPLLSPLPPLQMSDESTIDTPLRRPDDPNSVSFSPTPSFADSFSTAYTSHADFESSTSQPTSFLIPSPNLRKSLSVDSFVHYGHEPHPTMGIRGNTSLDPGQSLMKGHEYNASIPRNRGYSIGSPRGGGTASASYIVDSDVERSGPLNSSIDRSRRMSLKGQDQSKPLIRGGELPLPSRTSALGSTSSVSSIISASTNSSTLEDMPQQRSLTSLQFPLGREPISSNIGINSSSGRIRSGSLGMYTTPGKRMLVNTQLPKFDTYDSSPFVTIVVVGAVGCGKSVVIRKGLRGHALSEPVSLVGPSMTREKYPNYSRRIGRIASSETSPGCPLHVFEVDVPTESVDLKGLVWPESLSAIDGVIICYDSSNEASFKPIEGLLRGYRAMKVPVVVLACKSDLERQVEPERALEVLQRYDVGLVEVAKVQEQGKEKMRRTFEWLLKAVFRNRRGNRVGYDANYRNPASPDVLVSPPPWESSRTATPTASSSILPANHVTDNQTIPSTSTHPTLPPISSHSSILPSPPIRARSTGDLLYESEQSIVRTRHDILDGVHQERDSTDSKRDSAVETLNVTPENQKDSKEKESRPAQWATLDELLDKLLFLAVSGDDPAYITHFLLTYRRFASPRNVLLAMQKRMRQLDNPSDDPMFACFAQMRICNLLELWIRDYPYDFAVRGTGGALSALIKSIISKTYLLHYGSEFLPFLELLPSLVDQDAAWALKLTDKAEDSDDSPLEEDDEVHRPVFDPPSSSPISVKGKAAPSPPPGPPRERKTSLPLPSILSSGSIGTGQMENTDNSEKQQLKELVKLAQEVLAADPDEIAQEITRIEVKLFLDFKPRHWLYYTFVSGKKDGDPITAFNTLSNHLADWVVSLILCHERPRARAKQIEKFVEIAQRLRALNNYSALRAFVAGINSATYNGDETMEQFKIKSPEQAKNLQSWDVLLQHIRSHRAYRLALRNTKGACIPALEVHMSDLIRAHEGNEDFNPSDPTKIHWGKFNMMGKFISSTAQCQAQCRTTTDYNFPERSAIAGLFLHRSVMNNEMQKSRIAPEMDIGDYRPIPGLNQPRDAAILRKIFFW